MNIKLFESYEKYLKEDDLSKHIGDSKTVARDTYFKQGLPIYVGIISEKNNPSNTILHFFNKDGNNFIDNSYAGTHGLLQDISEYEGLPVTEPLENAGFSYDTQSDATLSFKDNRNPQNKIQFISQLPEIHVDINGKSKTYNEFIDFLNNLK